MRKLAFWALLSLVLADLVPALILDAESNIIALDNEAHRVYGWWNPPAPRWSTWKPGDWRILPDQPNSGWKLEP